ncbi:hypothetical protein [Methanoregula sp. UBA64]|jgi:hypothetical protein|uniref:hypothetical protein n=1 Tax=Methanoregula sp. UBA64 TaxID=1915554 RepID=UPI0025CC173B|nr:hypothetical protein [Methanoregula sp. UBA64]
MKKKYFTYAGIVAALILLGMFVSICLSTYPFPFLPPSATIDPVTNTSVDENNMLILTGTTTLSWYANMSVTLSSCPLPGNCTGGTSSWDEATIIPVADGGRNRWRSEFDLSSHTPADYQITVATYSSGSNYSLIQGAPIATGRFTLGDDNAGPEAIHKRSPVVQPYIRTNPLMQAGNTLIITGITSLAPATPIAWDLHTVTNITAASPGESQGTTVVIEGTEGVNRWSIAINNGTPGPGQYQIVISGNPAADASPTGAVSTSLNFAVPLNTGISGNTTGKPPGSLHYIAIDTLPDLHADGVYVITGTTSLPAGQGLMMNVYPAAFENGSYNFSVNARDTGPNATFSETEVGVFSGASGGTLVVNGTGGENLWSFDLATYKFAPGVYLINVSNDDFDTTTMTRKYGDLFSARAVPVYGNSS